jgi:hypothetical protein
MPLALTQSTDLPPTHPFTPLIKCIHLCCCTEVAEHPYEVTEKGWGEFEALIDLYFQVRASLILASLFKSIIYTTCTCPFLFF